MNNEVFYAIPYAHDEMFKLAEKFKSKNEAEKFALSRNIEIVREDYDGNGDAWLDDGNAIDWMVFTTKEIIEEYEWNLDDFFCTEFDFYDNA